MYYYQMLQCLSVETIQHNLRLLNVYAILELTFRFCQMTFD